MSDLQSDYDETHEVLAKANQRIYELEAEVERLRKTGHHCGCVSSEDGESIVESCMFHAKQKAEIERLKEYLLEVKQAASRCEDENERLRGENAMLLAAADADAFNLNTLQRCCCQRGARMQKMYAAIQDCTYSDNMDKEFSAWFDEDGVPIDIYTAMEGE